MTLTDEERRQLIHDHCLDRIDDIWLHDVIGPLLRRILRRRVERRFGKQP